MRRQNCVFEVAIFRAFAQLVDEVEAVEARRHEEVVASKYFSSEKIGVLVKTVQRVLVKHI